MTDHIYKQTDADLLHEYKHALSIRETTRDYLEQLDELVEALEAELKWRDPLAKTRNIAYERHVTRSDCPE